MATEKRLIDANETINVFTNWLTSRYDGRLPRDVVAQIPTVNALELPCKIGDRVWAIRNYKGYKHPKEGIVHEMFFTDDMRLHIVVKHIARGEWGRTIFATFEEAVAAIEGERKDND